MKITLPLGVVGIPLLLGLSLHSLGQASAPSEQAPPDYMRDVRPILTQSCFECHGPDEETREADLRFDIDTDLTVDLGGYSVIVPGKPDESEMILRIFDEYDPMPPVDEVYQLSDADKDVLRRWVAAGAKRSGHWAFEAPTRPKLPEVEDATWARNEIDRFVQARLELEGLKPEPEAERSAWLRRVSFDLIGLPPTLDELDAFLADDRPDAYERQVERLFASEHYGERQAQDWLDLARYADSSGNQFDTQRDNWKWRDWVIDAYNDNKPYDEFTVEQLAGDLLPNPTLDQLVATGFNRNNQTDTDSPSEPDEFRTEYVIDRVHTTSTAFMGMTMACAQCHAHKFDPISHEDYYSFYGFFNNVAERDIDYGNPRPNMRVPNPDQAPLLADYDMRIAELEARLKAPDPMFDRGQADWQASMRTCLGEPVTWQTLDPSGLMSQNGARLRVQDDGSILATGPTPARDVYDLAFQPGKRQVQALRLEVLPDPTQPEAVSGRSADGTFRLTKLVLRDGSLSDGTESPQIYMGLAEADVNQDVRDAMVEFENTVQPGSLDNAITYEHEEAQPDFGGFGGGRGWTLVGRATGERHEALLIPLEPLDLNDSSILKVTMEQLASGRAKSQIARFRWSVTEDERLRELMLPMAPKQWSTLGPFPSESVEAAFKTAYEPEEDLNSGIDRNRRYVQPEIPDPAQKDPAGPPKTGLPADSAGAPNAAAQVEGDKPLQAVDAPQAAVAATPPARATPAQRRATAPTTGGPVAEPVAAEPDAKPEVAQAAVPMEPEPKEPERKRPAKELTWELQDTWKDGDAATVEIGTGAYYLSREVHTSRAGLAELTFDGPDGVKVWLNGNLVFEAEPEPQAEEDEDGDSEFSFFMRDGEEPPQRVARIGFREGTNHVLVKAVFREAENRGRRRGASSDSPTGRVRFDFDPLGADVLSFEVLTALLADEPAVAAMKSKEDTVVSSKPANKLAPQPTDTKLQPGSADDEASKPDADVGLLNLDPPVQPTTLAPLETLGVRTIQPALQDFELAPEEHRAQVLRKHYRRNVSVVGQALSAELERLERERAQLVDDIPETLVMSEREVPRDNYVFLRGDYRQRGPDVPVNTPSVLPPMDPELPKNRLGLARWLTSSDHPLTARVAMNRMWQSFFGTGIVETPEDFGVRSKLPSHAALLDWMAVEFVESGWDWQAMQRRIVLSATYRQSASAAPEKFAADPANRLHARGPRLRLSAEMVRDNALAVSGLLVDEVGGESIKPYQAEGVWTEIFGGRDWRQDTGEDQYRRGLYVFWRRRAPYPSMTTFDAQKGETCTVTRPSTNTPLQALVLLNNPVYVEASRVFAQRLLTEDVESMKASEPASSSTDNPNLEAMAASDGSAVAAEVQAADAVQPPKALDPHAATAVDRVRIERGFRRCTSRPPTLAELDILADLLASQRRAFADDKQGALKLLEVGDAPGLDESSSISAEELAAWTALANALLNLDATIHRG